MPTYEYKCESCGYMFEAFQSIHDEPIKVCPKCGGPVRKLISSSYGMIFKGSGFYITDYKHKNSSSSTGGRNNGGTEKPKSGETKSTPKAEAKKNSE